MLAQGELGRNNTLSSSCLGPLAHDQVHPPRLEKCEFVLRRACKQRRRLKSRTQLASGLSGRRAKISLRGEAQSEYKQILVPFYTGQ